MIIYSIIKTINTAAIPKLVKIAKDCPYELVYFIRVNIKYPKIIVQHNITTNKSSFTLKSKSVLGIILYNK